MSMSWQCNIDSSRSIVTSLRVWSNQAWGKKKNLFQTRQVPKALVLHRLLFFPITSCLKLKGGDKGPILGEFTKAKSSQWVSGQVMGQDPATGVQEGVQKMWLDVGQKGGRSSLKTCVKGIMVVVARQQCMYWCLASGWGKFTPWLFEKESKQNSFAVHQGVFFPIIKFSLGNKISEAEVHVTKESSFKKCMLTTLSNIYFEILFVEVSVLVVCSGVWHALLKS